MKLLTLGANNIFSLGPITVDLMDRGLLLVTGHSYDEGSANGAGKSSVANKAISWGLYGQTFNGVKADAVVNQRDPEAKAYVEIDFLGVDGKPYLVYRQRNPAKLTLHQGDTNLTQRNQEDTQKLIDKALGKDFKTFSHTDFFGQGRTESFFSLTPADQKKIIESILPMEKLSQWADNCKKARAKLTEVFTRVKEEKIKANAYHDALSQQSKTFQSNSLNWQAQHETRLKSLREDIEKARLNATETSEKISTIVGNLALFPAPSDKDFEFIGNEIERWQTKIKDLEKNLQENEKQIAVQEREKAYQESRLRQLRHEGVCPTCFQFVSAEIVKEKQEEIQKVLQGVNDTLQNLLLENTNRIKQIQSFEEELEGKVSKLNAMLDKSRENQELENKLAVLRSNQHEKMLGIYEENLKTLEGETNQYGQMYEDTMNKLIPHLKVLSKLTDQIEALEKEIATVKLWEDGYAYDIKNMMIEQACPFLEERTNQYMKDLNNPQIRSTFSTVKLLKSGESRDEFSATVRSSTGGQEFDLFSGGEQQLTSFACGMALADLAGSQAEGSSEILILDEPFMGLSAMNCENVINFLTQILGQRKSTILLISNEEELKSLIPQSIHVVKRDGISLISL